MSEVTEAVTAAENEGLAVDKAVDADVAKVQEAAQAEVAQVETEVATAKSRVLEAIAGLEKHIQVIEADILAFTEHEKTAVQQYLLALKTRVHSLLLRL